MSDFSNLTIRSISFVFYSMILTSSNRLSRRSVNLIRSQISKKDPLAAPQTVDSANIDKSLSYSDLQTLSNPGAQNNNNTIKNIEASNQQVKLEEKIPIDGDVRSKLLSPPMIGSELNEILSSQIFSVSEKNDDIQNTELTQFYDVVHMDESSTYDTELNITDQSPLYFTKPMFDYSKGVDKPLPPLKIYRDKNNNLTRELPSYAHIYCYIYTIFRAAQVEPEVLLCALKYLTTILETHPEVSINSLNYERLILGLIVLASKCLDDLSASSKSFCKIVNHLTPQMLAVTESYILVLIKYRSFINAETYKNVYYMLKDLWLSFDVTKTGQLVFLYERGSLESKKLANRIVSDFPSVWGLTETMEFVGFNVVDDINLCQSGVGIGAL